MPFKFGLPPMRAGRRSCASAGWTRTDRKRMNAASAGSLWLIGITLTEVGRGLVYAHRAERRPNSFYLGNRTALVAERGGRGGSPWHRERGRTERRGRGSGGPR